MINLDELEALATAATQGPWETCLFKDEQSLMHYEEWGVHCPNHPDARQHNNGEWHSIHVCRGMTGPNRANNATFIAAVHPQVILELITEYKRMTFDSINLLFQNKLAARIIEPLANEGNPHARFWMAGFGRKIAIDEPSNYDDAIQTINNLMTENARLRAERNASLPSEITAQRIAAVRALIKDLNNSRREWKITIPPKQTDPDLIIGAALDAAELEIARLRAELAAKTPPPAVPSYHRLDFSEKRACNRCGFDMDDVFMTDFGQEDMCNECAAKYGAKRFVPQEDE